jgi:predicted dinucleotide-binding enzyme
MRITPENLSGEKKARPQKAFLQLEALIFVNFFLAASQWKEGIHSISFAVSNKKIVISIANPLHETYNGLVTAPDTSAAEELQKLPHNSKVVKAFNTTFAADFTTPVIDGKQVDAFVAGNDEEAVQTVTELEDCRF